MAMTNPGSRITQGTFSFLHDLTDEEIKSQIKYCIDNGWAVNVEFTDDPHPRNTFWEMWGLPMFDMKDPAAILYEVNECRKAFPSHYIRVTGFDSRRGWETPRLSFIVHRPTAEEPGFRLIRTEDEGRTIRYTIQPYVTEAKPEGERYR